MKISRSPWHRVEESLLHVCAVGLEIPPSDHWTLGL
jgi:hypothetical protein